MPTLYKEDWPLFWTPNADNINGDPRGLLRADNLTKDEDGVLSLIRGTRIISNQLISAPTQIFGKILDLNSAPGSTGGYSNSAHVRYVVLENGKTVLRNYSPAQKNENVYDLGIISDGGDQGAAFGFGFGHVFITSGTKKIKDDGITQSPLGLPKNNPPGVGINPPPMVKMRGPNATYVEWNARENGTQFDNTGDYVLIDSNVNSGRAIAVAGQYVALNIDGNTLTSATGTGQGTDDDIYSLAVRIGDTGKLIKIRVEYLMQPPEVPGFNPDATDYYYHEWIAGSDPNNPNAPVTTFNPGINTWTTIECKRNEFTRVGTDSNLSWSNIKGIRVTFVTTDQQTFAFTDPKFTGGSTGPLDGFYDYVQVDVYNNGFYAEKSISSEASNKVHVIKSSTYVQPTTVHSSANECWIFRSGGTLSGYYRIKVITGAKGFTPAQFNDTMSDEDALALGIQLDYYQENLPDGIIGMETNFKGRNWYMTYERVYPSYRDNVSSYDSRYVIDTFGNTEYNLFICKLSTDAMILATNLDFYEISGSAGVIIQNDIEYFDLVVRPLGINTPSISREFAVREGNLFYLAGDGIRVLAGTSCQLLSNNIDLLFNHHTRHGIAPVKLIPLELYYIGVANNRLYFSFQQEDNKRALYIYNFADQNWRYEEHGDQDSIQALFVEDDHTIIYSTASFGDRFVRRLDIGQLFDESRNINFKFLTVFDHNGAPRNRKDSFTLKITADTGDTGVFINLRGYYDTENFVTYSTTDAFFGREEKYYQVYDTIGAVKSYQLEIYGTVPICKIYNFSIDYDQRPEQLNILRIPPSNYGIAGRKRIPEIPMIIDTMGKDVTFIPRIDGVNHPAGTIRTYDRTVYHYLFPGDVAGFNVGGTLTGNLFEFYELVNPREFELLPDPLRYKTVPYSNLGTTSRKRFIQYAVIIDTFGVNVQMDIFIDNVAQSSKIFATFGKRTYINTLEITATGVDIACSLTALTAQPFEFYGLSLDECVFEKLPPISKYIIVPNTNMGTSSRKRFIQYALVIDTRGADVQMTPHVDQKLQATKIINTNAKRTVISTLDENAVGVDIGCTLLALTETPFEFYGVNLDDSVFEKLPPLSKFITVPTTNFGTAAKKRIRTIPLVIDTKGGAATYTPIVDGRTFPSSTFITNDKRTVLHYFENTTGQCGEGIPFGIDYGGTISASNDMEFYQVLQPEIVEILPVGKKFDQFGPIEFSKIGKIREISIRMVATADHFNFCIFSSDTPILAGKVSTIPNKEKTYVIGVPKGVNPNIFRMEIDAPDVFHRFDAEIKINIDGAVTANKRIKVK